MGQIWISNDGPPASITRSTTGPSTLKRGRPITGEPAVGPPSTLKKGYLLARADRQAWDNWRSSAAANPTGEMFGMSSMLARTPGFSSIPCL